MKKDRYYHTFISLFEKKLGWGDISRWTDKNYKRLTLEIYHETGTSISHNTFKRIFGKVKTNSDYVPQPATEDALARFIGFQNWMDFVKHVNSQEGDDFIPDSPLEKTRKPYIKRILFRKVLSITILALLMSILLLWVIFTPKQERPLSVGVFSLQVDSIVKKAPNTFVFSYDVSQIKDTVFLKFNDRKHYLPPHNNSIRLFIRRSGLYFAELISAKQILDSVFFMATQVPYEVSYSGIYRGSEKADNRIVPIEIMQGKPYFFIPQAEAQKYAPENQCWLNLNLYKEFGVSADNFIFETSVKKIKNHECADFSIQLVTRRDKHQFYFNSPTCAPFVYLKVGEHTFNGTMHDLSMFLHDFSEFVKISIRNHDKHVSVYVNHEKVYDIKYSTNMGDILGIRFSIKCDGAIEYIRLSDENDSLQYLEDFSSGL